MGLLLSLQPELSSSRNENVRNYFHHGLIYLLLMSGCLEALLGSNVSTGACEYLSSPSEYLAVISSLGRGGAAVFGWDLNLIGHDAPAVQHLGTGSLQLLQDLGQLGIVVTRWAPA